MIYNYYTAMYSDILDFIVNNELFPESDEDKYDYCERLNSDLWAESSITGNGPYYYDSESKCCEYVAQNLSLYFSAATEWESFPNYKDKWIYDNPGQKMDQLIRCYLLYGCIMEVIDVHWEEWHDVEKDSI